MWTSVECLAQIRGLEMAHASRAAENRAHPTSYLDVRSPRV